MGLRTFVNGGEFRANFGFAMAVLLSLCEHRQQNRALKTEALLAVEALLLVCVRAEFVFAPILLLVLGPCACGIGRSLLCSAPTLGLPWLCSCPSASTGSRTGHSRQRRCWPWRLSCWCVSVFRAIVGIVTACKVDAVSSCSPAVHCQQAASRVLAIMQVDEHSTRTRASVYAGV